MIVMATVATDFEQLSDWPCQLRPEASCQFQRKVNVTHP